VGPLSLQILEPLRSFRLVLTANDSGIECDQRFTARTNAEEEPRSVLHDDGRLIMNTTRFTQLGRWQGHIVVRGRRIEVNATRSLGARDKSWGIRPVGEPEGGAPPSKQRAPQVYWIWAPLDFGDFGTQFNTFESADGTATQLGACRLPAGDDIDAHAVGNIEPMPVARHRIEWQPGTRYAKTARIDLTDRRGREIRIELEPLLRFHMAGVGYHHPEWGHGLWKGELVDLEAMEVAACRHSTTAIRWCERQQMARQVTAPWRLCPGPHQPSDSPPSSMGEGEPSRRPATSATIGSPRGGHKISLLRPARGTCPSFLIDFPLPGAAVRPSCE
jgi:hypothetical protein